MVRPNRLDTPRRRPVWRPSIQSRMLASVRRALGRVTFAGFTRAVVVLVLASLLPYLCREVFRDSIIIEPFSVPKRFEDVGLSGEVLANRIGDAMRRIEVSAKTDVTKDSLSTMRDERSIPNVEIPGTKIELKTLIQIAQAILGRHPQHVSGDVVISVATGSCPATEQLDVTVYVTRGRDRSSVPRFSVPGGEADSLPQAAAEMILRQVSPYILAVYKYDHREFTSSIEIAERIAEDPN